MMQQPLNFDIPARRGRSRRTDPSTSVAAGQATNATRLEGIVQSFLTLMYPRDFNTKELASELGMDRVTISPRMICLERRGRAVRVGRRDKCETWRAIK